MLNVVALNPATQYHMAVIHVTRLVGCTSYPEL